MDDLRKAALAKVVAVLTAQEKATRSRDEETAIDETIDKLRPWLQQR